MKFASNMSKPIVMALAGLALSPAAFADEAARIETSDRYSEQIDALKHGDQPQITESQTRERQLPSDEERASRELPKELQEDYLLSHVDVLESHLILALRAMRVDMLDHLLPIYAKVPDSGRDDSALMWGDAILTYAKGERKEAIDKYRRLLALLPDNNSIRFQLAASLFQDAQYDASKDQFEKLGADETLVKSDREMVEWYLKAIASKSSWSFDAGLQYAYDENVNSAPKEGTKYQIGDAPGSASREKPIEGRGVNYSADLGKRWVFDNRMYTKLSGSLWGTHYWTARSYSDLGLKLSAGLGYDNGNFSTSVTPYVQKKLYGYGSRGTGRLHNYYRSLGVGANMGYWFTNKTKSSVGIDLGKDVYIEDYKSNTGPYLSAYWQVYHYPKKTRYFYGTLSYFGKSTETYKYNNFRRVGARLGWYQEWPLGISTILAGSYGYRWYLDADPFLKINQHRHEWNARVTLWHKAIHFSGITPRLVLGYNKVDSNVSLYSFSGFQGYLDFSKRF